jgi:hypothetical protein
MKYILAQLHPVPNPRTLKFMLVGFSVASPVYGQPKMRPLAFPLIVREATIIQGYMEDSHSSAVEVRSFFPETWLWELQYTGCVFELTNQFSGNFIVSCLI